MILSRGRIPLTVQPWFWVLAAFIGWMNSASLMGMAIWVLAIFASILIHEYGHALTAIAFKQRASIQLMVFGGVTQREGPRLKLWQEFLVVLNGPLAGLALYCIIYSWALAMPPESVPMEIAVSALLFINLFWTVLNLFPILPLDGGHLMRILLEAIMGVNGIKVSLWLSTGFAVLAGVGCLFIGQILAGVLFISFAFDSYSTVSQMGKLAKQDRDIDLVTEFQRAESVYQNGQIAEALFLFQQLRAHAKEGMLFNAATQYAVQILEKQGRSGDAYQMLLNLHQKPSDAILPLWHKLAYQNKDFRAVADVGDQCYQVAPSYEVAFMNAVAHAAFGEETPAMGWLRCAEREGMPGMGAIVSSTEEFDKFAHSAAFLHFMESLDNGPLS